MDIGTWNILGCYLIEIDHTRQSYINRVSGFFTLDSYLLQFLVRLPKECTAY